MIPEIYCSECNSSPVKPVTETEFKAVEEFEILPGQQVWERVTGKGPWIVVSVGVDNDTRLPNAIVSMGVNLFGEQIDKRVYLATLAKERPKGTDWWTKNHMHVTIVALFVSTLALIVATADLVSHILKP